MKLCDFLAAVAPVKSQKSSELISQDIHTSTKSYKFTYSVELVPLCKDDLVCLPSKLAKSLGNIPQLLICTRVGSSVHLIDPNTLQMTEISNQVYWREPFNALADVTELKEYFILDIEPLGPTHGKYVLADVEVMRTSDNTQFSIRTHLGGILHAGDDAMGYHLLDSNFNDPNFDALDTNRVPPVLLVKKHYPRRKKKSRNWKLKRMGREESEMLPRKQDQEKAERDYELFLQSLEEDTELRGTVALYKNPDGKALKPPKPEDMDMDDIQTEDGYDGLKIDVDELLDEFEERMTLDEASPV